MKKMYQPVFMYPNGWPEKRFDLYTTKRKAYDAIHKWAYNNYILLTNNYRIDEIEVK